jgi:catecholate siderophore receptor
MRLRRLLLLFAAVSLVVPGRVGAQPASFLFHGRVFDPMRGSIVGARISAVEDRQIAGQSAVSDQNGDFTLMLDAGRYTITASADGFLEASQAIVIPQTGSASREFVLQVAGVRDTVTVTALAPGYAAPVISSGTKTLTPLRDVPQSVTVVTQALIRDQLMTSITDVVRYVPGITAHQGENNRDQVIIRGNNSSADFFLNGVRDDVQYYRDLYNLDRVEALKGPNALIFGRGGGGGAINRVTKEASFAALHEVTLQGGAYGNRRFTTDLDQPLSHKAAFRLNGMYENSDSFRNAVNLERYGISPTLTITPDDRTKITLGYEYFRDARIADRGIPSFQGRPADIGIATYFGNPDDSHVRAGVNLGSATIDRQAGAVHLRNSTLFGDYDRGYQNFVPGAVTPDKTQVALSAYNNATRRRNIFNQTDLTYAVSTGRIRHTLLAGVEVGHQLTDNFRNTGFFNNTAASILVPYANPTITTPVTFRQNATDANNHLTTNVAATYAQDQIELSPKVQVIAGLRFDHFELQYHNNRNGDDLRRADDLVSPRAGLVFKPVAALSLYGSYSMSSLPSSGDQFSSLTTVTQQLKPEQFDNYEGGAKWEVRPTLSLTTALYRLDRTNTRATDPNDPTRIVQTGSQRTNGVEVGINGHVTGAWQIAGGYAFQNAFVTSATTAAPAGAQVAQAPRHSLSLWNNYQLFPKVAVALGVVRRSDMYAAIDNTVTVPGFVEAETAVYVALTGKMRLQANVDNVFDQMYYANADNNTNISPGSPRAIRVALIVRF